jgi:hypothetical protein
MSTAPTARLLLTASCFAVVGCVDSTETVLRDRLALATEKVDLIMHVVDQETAKEYTKFWLPRMERRLSELDDRQRKVDDNMDKKAYKEWQAYDKYIKERISKKEYPEKKDAEKKDPEKKDAENKDLEPQLPTFYFRYARERVACEKALSREAERLAKVVAELQARGAEAGEVSSVLAGLGGAVKK